MHGHDDCTPQKYSLRRKGMSYPFFAFPRTSFVTESYFNAHVGTVTNPCEMASFLPNARDLMGS